jgi:hypothetical protein
MLVLIGSLSQRSDQHAAPNLRFCPCARWNRDFRPAPFKSVGSRKAFYAGFNDAIKVSLDAGLFVTRPSLAQHSEGPPKLRADHHLSLAYRSIVQYHQKSPGVMIQSEFAQELNAIEKIQPMRQRGDDLVTCATNGRPHCRTLLHLQRSSPYSDGMSHTRNTAIRADFCVPFLNDFLHDSEALLLSAAEPGGHQQLLWKQRRNRNP